MSETPRIIKHWRIIRDHVPHWTPTQQLNQLKAWLREGRRFFHTRYNDGECAMMQPTQSTKASLAKGQHRWERGLCKEMRKAFDEVLAAIDEYDMQQIESVLGASRPLEHLLVGSWWATFRLGDLPPLEELAWLGGKIKNAGLTEHRWAWPDLWYSSFAETADCCEGSTEVLLELLKALPNEVVLIGNEHLRPIAERKDWGFVQVASQDCWDNGPRVLEQTKMYASTAGEKHQLAIWCCGPPAKVWSWQLWKEGLGSHLDAGHLFDRAAGLNSRDWHNRANGIHRKEYDKLIAPWLGER